ncbi:PKD domain-containing protein [bacterium]|nr:PKD domain-containing protein [bacterium]
MAILAALGMIACVSCGGGHTTLGDTTGEANGGTIADTNPANLTGLVRTASDDEPITFRYGSDYLEELPYANVDRLGSCLNFLAEENVSAYCHYSFLPTEYEGNFALRFNWYTEPAAGSTWIGLANYANDEWDWFEYITGQPVMPTAPEPYFNDDDEMYVVVQVCGDTQPWLYYLCVGDEPNWPPEAAITASHSYITVPTEVTFDASASTDTDGTIVEYAWDIHNDGGIDQTTTDPVITHMFASTSETGIVRVVVTDDDGATDEAYVSLSINDPPAPGDWVEIDMIQGWYPGALAVVNSEPVFANTKNITGMRIKYGLNDSGTSWAPTAAPSYAPYEPFFNEYDLCALNGCLGMLIESFTGNSLLFTHAARVHGTTFNEPVLITSRATGFAYAYSASLAVVNGHPAIAYARSDESGLHYLRATDDLGEQWPQGSQYSVLTETSGTYVHALEIINGNPAICWADSDLHYSQAQDNYGNNWYAPVTAVDGEAGNVCFASLINADGFPAILFALYHEMLPTSVKLVRAADAEGQTWNTPVTVVEDSIHNLAAGVLNGIPVIAYGCSEGNKRELMYMEASDAAGSTWQTPYCLSDEVEDLDGLSLVTNAGRPMISITYGDYPNSGEARFFVRY